jgi:curved DNA-binding protein CbpA
MFKEINEANSVLSDKDKRRQYDLGAYDPTNPEGPSAPPGAEFS